MAGTYNDRLRKGVPKGLCGDEELQDPEDVLNAKVAAFAALVRDAERIVVYTGAGVSTASGVPDFRGPRGVWTAEQQGRSPPRGTPFEEAKPSYTHEVLADMVADGTVAHIVTQNVDSLHRKSGVPREKLSELHGNVFVERCASCDNKEFVRDFDVGTVGFRETGRKCPHCGGALRDFVLDWDSELQDLEKAIEETKRADLCIVLGSSLRIRPAGNFPMRTVRRNSKPREGRLVIVNLQRTHLDRQCDVRLFANIDDVMRRLVEQLETEEEDDEDKA